jgi:hypothetical protein
MESRISICVERVDEDGVERRLGACGDGERARDRDRRERWARIAAGVDTDGL